MSSNIQAVQTGSGWDVDGPMQVPVFAQVDTTGRPIRTVTPDGQVVGGGELDSPPTTLMQANTIVETRRLPRSEWYTRRPGNPLIDLTAAPSQIVGNLTRSVTNLYSAGMGFGGTSTSAAGTVSLAVAAAGTYAHAKWTGSWTMPADGLLQLLAFVPAGIPSADRFNYSVTNSSGGSARFEPVPSMYTQPDGWNVLPIWATGDADIHSVMTEGPQAINVTVSGGGISPGDTIVEIQIAFTKTEGSAYTLYFTPIFTPPKIKPLMCLTIDALDDSSLQMFSIMSAAGMPFGLAARNEANNFEWPLNQARFAACVAAGGEVFNGTFSRANLTSVTEAELIKEYVLTEQKLAASNLPLARDFCSSGGNSVPNNPAIRKSAYPKIGKRFVRGLGPSIALMSPIGIHEGTNLGCRSIKGIDRMRTYIRAAKKIGGVFLLFGHAIRPRAGDPESALSTPSDGNFMWTEDFEVFVGEIMSEHALGNLCVVAPSQLGPILDGRVSPGDLPQNR